MQVVGVAEGKAVGYSLINVSFPIEAWRQPRVPDSGAATLDVVIEPSV